MKNVLKTVIAGVATISMGCAKNSDTPTVTTSLVMTGSGQASTIAKYKMQHPWLSMFMPSAVALTPPALVDSKNATVNLTKAWIVIKEIEFKPTEVAGESEASEAPEVEFQGPYFVDLLSAAPSALGSAEVPVATYRRIKMKLEKGSTIPADAPAGLNGNSIYFEGTVAGNQFTYVSDDGTEFQIGGAGGMDLSSNANLLVAIKVSDLFKMIDLSSVTNGMAISSSNRVAGANLCPLIDASAADLYTCFRKGLEKAGKFGKDDDGDHEMEADEDEVHD